MASEKFHQFTSDVSGIEPPSRFTYPFHYVPHPLATAAAEEAKNYVASREDWQKELQLGKMLGVLVARDENGNLGFLAAFSGNLAGSNNHEYFVPPVYDLLQPDGEFKRGEAEISAINQEIKELENSESLRKLQNEVLEAEQKRDIEIDTYKNFMQEAKAERETKRTSGINESEKQALIAESQFQKAELKRLKQHYNEFIESKKDQLKTELEHIQHLKTKRKTMSEALQERIFRLFVVNNGNGQRSDLIDVFHTFYKTHPTLQASIVPPSGSGECCAPKLLQYAFDHGLKPLCMAEFWWGDSPVSEVRHHGHYYGACLSKCRPILSHMLQGVDVEENALAQKVEEKPLEILYDDEWIVAVNKPAGMLTVPGRLHDDSLQSRLAEHLGINPLVVHRLDMMTSGIVIFAKTKEVHKQLQELFATHQIRKTYVALLDGIVEQENGTIDLPLRPNIEDRPRQMVDYKHGKRAVTTYEVLERTDGITRIAFHPKTGRTHQLRMHASHPSGLNCPIVGDMLYGRAAERLMLHAHNLTFIHPMTHETVTITATVPF